MSIRQLFLQDTDTTGMTVTTPLTSITAIQSWITAGNTALALSPAESLGIVADVVWVIGIPNAAKFVSQTDHFLDRLEKENGNHQNCLPKNLIRFLERLSEEDLNRMTNFLPPNTFFREERIGEPVRGYQLIGDSMRFTNGNNPLKNLTEEEWKKLEEDGKLIRRIENNGVALETRFTRLGEREIHVEMGFSITGAWPPVAENPFQPQLEQLSRLSHEGSLRLASLDETYRNDLRRAIELAEQLAQQAHSKKDVATELRALDYKAAALGKLGRWRERIRVRWRQVIATRHSPPIVHIEKIMVLGSDYLAMDEFEKGARVFRQAVKVSIENPSPLRRHKERLMEVLEMEVIAWRMAGKDEESDAANRLLQNLQT